MPKTRKWAVLIFTLFIILWALNALLFSWVVPQTAAFTIPRKWSLIPLGQSKTIVHGYLGEPSVAAGPDTPSEVWASGSQGKMYYLRIQYHADTIAIDYSIRYLYRNWLVTRNYLIDSVSIR